MAGFARLMAPSVLKVVCGLTAREETVWMLLDKGIVLCEDGFSMRGAGTGRMKPNLCRFILSLVPLDHQTAQKWDLAGNPRDMSFSAMDSMRERWVS